MRTCPFDPQAEFAVYVQIEFNGSEHCTSRFKLICTIEQCEGLQQADWVGDNDCYCVVTVGEEQQETSTVYNSGGNPAWGKGEGETLEWVLD